MRDSLRALATQIASKRGADVDDLHQLALEIACRRVVDYDERRGAFFTYLYDTVRYALADACERERKGRLLNKLIAKGAAKLAPYISPGGSMDAMLGDRGEALLDASSGLATSIILAHYPQPPTPEESYLSADERVHLRRRVDAALASLDEVDRVIVVRHHLEDAPLTEVQRELGIAKYSEVRARHVAAMVRLAKRLKRAA